MMKMHEVGFAPQKYFHFQCKVKYIHYFSIE